MDKLNNYYGRLFTQAQLSDALKKAGQTVAGNDKIKSSLYL